MPIHRRYGFTWGPLDVERTARFRAGTPKETHMLTISTFGAGGKVRQTLTLCASLSGRSLRVFDAEGNELLTTKARVRRARKTKRSHGR